MKIVRLQGFNKFERQLLKSLLSKECVVSELPFGTHVSEGDYSIFFSVLSVSELKQKRYAFGESFNPDLVICFTSELQVRNSSRELSIATNKGEDVFEVLDITKEELATFFTNNGIGVRSKDNSEFFNFFDCQSAMSAIVDNYDFIITGIGTFVTLVEFSKIMHDAYEWIYRKLKEKTK